MESSPTDQWDGRTHQGALNRSLERRRTEEAPQYQVRQVLDMVVGERLESDCTDSDRNHMTDMFQRSQRPARQVVRRTIQEVIEVDAVERVVIRNGNDQSTACPQQRRASLEEPDRILDVLEDLERHDDVVLFALRREVEERQRLDIATSTATSFHRVVVQVDADRFTTGSGKALDELSTPTSHLQDPNACGERRELAHGCFMFPFVSQIVPVAPTELAVEVERAGAGAIEEPKPARGAGLELDDAFGRELR